ncbi:MAG: hypothetical protein IPP71_08120 [Bacteroidetes bacterium]|nr:hypothetical protein [Bacteroidota bacterium]
MKYEIVELAAFSGERAAIYSIKIEDDGETLFDKFIESNQDSFPKEIKDLLQNIVQIGKYVGTREKYFKINEGKPGDGVCALFDWPEKKLRLYCIRYQSVAIIIGGGGYKPSHICAWQDDENLKSEAELIIKIAKDVNRRIKDNEIVLLENTLYSDTPFIYEI